MLSERRAQVEANRQEKIADVSVIIPCFSCASTIERAVRSIINQTMRPREIIMVDDASVDDTLDRLYAIRNNFTVVPIHIIPLTVNQGPATARNVGWESAGSLYIAFLDADDAWHPHKLEYQYGWMVRNPSAVLSGHEVSDCGDLSKVGLEADRSDDFMVIHPRRLLIRNELSTPSIMLRKDIPYRFTAGKRFSEDYLLWCQICCSGYPCYKSRSTLAVLYKAKFGEGGLSGQIWKMERGELDVYRFLLRTRLIGFVQYILCVAASCAKFVRRVFGVYHRKLCNTMK